MSMFGWLATIGIGGLALEFTTSAYSAVAGKFYGEHKTQNQMKKKVNKFAKRLETRLKSINIELNNDHINTDIANINNNNLAKTQIYGNKKYKELDRKIEEEKKKIFKDLYDLLLTEWDKKKLDEVKEIIKNIKNNINKGNQLTLEDVKQLYGIFAKKSWIVEKFSPNVIRQNDFLITILMDEIIAPLKGQKDTDYKNNININNKENIIINDDTKKNNLLNAIFTQEFDDENTNTEMKKYRVFFDFLARYSGYGNGINSDINTKWQYNDCVLVEEFIKDKQFDMYEDIEGLPECCRQIDNIRCIYKAKLQSLGDNKELCIKKIDDMLYEKYKSLEAQLDKICKQDERLKDCNKELKDKIQAFKNKLNGNSQELKPANESNIIDKKNRKDNCRSCARHNIGNE